MGAVLVGGGYVDWQRFQEVEKTKHRLYRGGWDLEETTGQQSVRQKGTVQLLKWTYASMSAHPQTPVRYSVELSVSEPNPIDVIVLDPDEYDRYRKRDKDTQFISRLSSMRSTEDSVASTVPAMLYHFVFDNTGVFGADPQREVTVKVMITTIPA